MSAMLSNATASRKSSVRCSRITIMPIHVAFVLTRGDYRIQLTEALRLNTAQKLGHILFLFIAFPSVVWAFNEFKPIPFDTWKDIFHMPQVHVSVFIYVFAVFYLHYPLSWLGSLSFKTQYGANKKITGVIDTQGFSYDMEGIISYIPWNKILKCVVRSDRIFVYLSRRGILTLPKRGFANETQWNEAIQVIAQNLDQEAFHG